MKKLSYLTEDSRGIIKRIRNFYFQGEEIEATFVSNETAEGKAMNLFHTFEKKTEDDFHYYTYLQHTEQTNDTIISYKHDTISKYSFEMLPNRNYIISALIRTNFEEGKECNLNLATKDANGKLCLDQNFGLPFKTDGWVRYEHLFTSDFQSVHGYLSLATYGFEDDKDQVDIADICFIELPANDLVPFHKGEGATFLGGPGKIPMYIENCEVEKDNITVETIGAKYIFNLQKSKLYASQKIDYARDIAEFDFDLPLQNLEVLTHNNKECVLANDAVTFGVQCDGLLIIVPHNELQVVATSRIAGKWNRLAYGNMIVSDTTGGFTVTPDIPWGTGRLPRVDTGIWPGRCNKGMMDFCGIFDNQTFISKAEKGFSVKWEISPGERLGISVFPPKKFPWKESFDGSFAIASKDSTYEEFIDWSKHTQAVILWDIFKRHWGLSFSAEYPILDEEMLEKQVSLVKKCGMKPIPYMSPWFYISRDPKQFTDEVRRLKDKYGFEGVYYDGLPTESWVVAYELIRLTREIYSDGCIVMHNTYPSPMMEGSIGIPCLASYADITYMGEDICGESTDWVYPKYFMTQQGKSNSVGAVKANKWKNITPAQIDMLMLYFNSRQCFLPIEFEGAPGEKYHRMKQYYFPALAELKQLWQEHQDDDNFYMNYFAPKVKELTKKYLPQEEWFEFPSLAE